MRKVKFSMAATAILFAIAAASALFIWHSWYLYCGAVLTGYVALILQTVILRRSFHFEKLCPGQFVSEQGRFYNVVANRFGLLCLINFFVLFFLQDSIDTRVLFMVLNLVTLMIFQMITLYFCEGNDWKFWYPKALFG